MIRGRYFGRGVSSGAPTHQSQGSHAFYRGGANTFNSRGTLDDPPGRDITEGLVEKPLKIIQRDHAPIAENIAIADLQYVASYNWVGSEEPTIIVPGSPRVWLDKPLPFSVEPDSGETFIDQDAHRLPSSPLLPLFRAVDIMEREREKPILDWRSVDVVTDRNNLRKLLAWASGSDEMFRIDVQLAGEWTMLLQGWESRSIEMAVWAGFGNSFERASTRPAKGCEAGTLAGHCRIVTYELGGMKLVVLFEVDAYDPALYDPAQQEHDDNQISNPLETLTNAVLSLSVGEPASTSVSGEPALHVIRAGTEVPQSALIKIKTRPRRNIQNLDWDAIYPQLYIGQTPTLKIGVHQRGNFEEVQTKKLDAPELREVARETETNVKKLWAVLKELHNLAMAHGKNARISVVSGEGVLQVMERESTDSFLPEHVLKRFDTTM